ncbi:MAG TPA: hypothetical protein DD417_15485 [Elusimicrobia bacterium]|nr:hypothetical protein [Elusimicrobiota bacterium]
MRRHGAGSNTGSPPLATALVRLRILMAIGANIAILGCAHAKPMAVFAGAPEWISRGSGVFSQGPPAFYGIGIAHGISGEKRQLAAADHRGRAEVARLLYRYMWALAESRGSSTIASGIPRLLTFSQELDSLFGRLARGIEGGQYGVCAIDHWKDPAHGTLFSLVKLDLAVMQNALETSRDFHVGAGVMDYVKANSKEAFDKLKVTPEAFPPKSLREWSAKNPYAGGIGVAITFDSGPVITGITPGSDAERGLIPGDRLLEIEHNSVQGLTADQITSRLRGPVESIVNVTIMNPKRENGSGRLYLSLERDLRFVEWVDKEEAVRRIGESAAKGELFGGVGMILAEDDGIMVLDIIPGLPAERAGVRRGDRVTGIDQVATKGLSMEQAIERIRGEPSSHVRLTIVRYGRFRPKDYDLIREKIDLTPLESRVTQDFRQPDSAEQSCHVSANDSIGMVPRNLLGIPAGIVGFAVSLPICIAKDIAILPYLIDRSSHGDAIEIMLWCHAGIPTGFWAYGGSIGAWPFLKMKERIVYRNCDTGTIHDAAVIWDRSRNAK